MIASVSRKDATARVWDVATGDELLRIDMAPRLEPDDELSSVALSRDGLCLGVGTWRGQVIILSLRRSSGSMTVEGQHTSRPHTARVRGLCFCDDGQRLATASWDGTATVMHRNDR